MSEKLTVFFRRTACVLLVVLFAGCGTIMYPNRSGLKGGEVDMGVVLMDGLCVLLLVVPGVVAYIVDFSTGCIYLPGTFGSIESGDMKKLTFDAEKSTMKDIENMVSKETGLDISVNDKDVKIYSFRSLSELRANIAFITHGNDAVLSLR